MKNLLKKYFSKKYFYPLLTEFEIYKNFKKDDQKLTIAENAAKNILCLPIYPELEEKERVKIVNIILDQIN